jgi:hypothetical protein
MADKLALLQTLQRLGLWPTREIPEHGGPFIMPAPDMPDLGFPRPNPNLTDPGEEFRAFYGPGSAQAPMPLPMPYPGRIPSVPYPVGPRPEGQT